MIRLILKTLMNNSILIFSKLLFVVVLIFLNNEYYSQIYISEGTSIYLENEILSAKEELVVINYSKGKIYVSADAKITILDNEINYEIVEIHTVKKQDAKYKKQPILNNLKKDIFSKTIQKISINKDSQTINKYLFSKTESTTYFSLSNNNSKIIISNSQLNVETVISSEYNSLSIQGWSKEVKIYYKNTITLASQYKSVCSVRPPPQLL